MAIFIQELTYSTKGNTDIVNITDDVGRMLKETELNKGLVTVFVSGSTAGITTVEYESGLIKDLKEFFEAVIPQGKHYHHDAAWGDGNGYAHIRSAILGTGKTFPFERGKLLLGTWQQIILIDFDNRPRTRKIIVQMMGE